MVSTEVFATKERQEILNECGISYAVNQDLNFVFKNETQKNDALRILKDACEL